MKKLKATAIILAGGKSRRMGMDKSLLPYRGKSLISKIVSEFQNTFEETIIVSNEKNKYNFPSIKEISDIYPGLGPLSGIHAGLKASKYQYIFVTACDMPYITDKIPSYLFKNIEGYDVVVLRSDNLLHPLCSFYSKNCLPFIEENLKNKINKVIDFYPLVKVNYVDVKLLNNSLDMNKLLININTPQDYEAIINNNL